MKYLFNFKLYLEGLKKIRLVGIITGIVVIIANAIPPIANLIDSESMVADSFSESTTVMTASDFAIPMILILFLTPFFFLSMFSFLNKRNESDFYHAIPYKRSCVLFSFLSAIFTWIWGIILTSTLLTGLLWALCPYRIFAFSVMPMLFGVYAAATLYIGSFILLAMTLTGTATSNIAVSAILLFLVRIVGVITVEVLEEMVPLFDISFSPFRFLSMRYWLPAAIISSFYDSSVFQNGALWIYSIAVLLVLYALATYCYCRRKSESAGKSAPGKKLQHVYRCAFTLPLALLTTLAALFESDLSLFVILLLLTLAIYFLYELITTKSVRSMLRSAPYLLALIVCSLLFTGGCYLTRNTVLEGEYQTDEISAIRFYDYSSIYDLFIETDANYEELMVNAIRIPDEKAAEIVSKALAETIQSVREEKYWIYTSDTMTQYVEITLSSGRKVGRKIEFQKADYEELLTIIQSTDEYRNAYISLPDRKEIQSLSANYISNATEKELLELWDLFTEEYSALNKEEQVEFKNRSLRFYTDIESDGITDSLYIRLNGSNGTQTYSSRYLIPESFTKTRAYYYTLLEKTQDALREKLNAFLNGNYDQQLLENDDSYFCLNMNFDFQTGEYSDSFYADLENWYGSFENDERSVSAQKELLRILLPYLTATPDQDQYCRASFGIYTENSYEAITTLFGFRELSQEETAKLKQTIIALYEDDPEEVRQLLVSFTKGELDSYFPPYLHISAYAESTKECIEFSSDSMDGRISYTEKAKQEFAALLPHLSTEITDISQTCQICIEYIDHNDEYVVYIATFGWDGFWGEPTVTES